MIFFRRLLYEQRGRRKNGRQKVEMNCSIREHKLDTTKPPFAMPNDELNMPDLALAIDGAAPVFPGGPPHWPVHDPEILAALEAAHADGSWGKYDGRHNTALIDALCKLHQIPLALPCCSGTFAVELALRALRISAADEVILAAYDFSGNFRCIEAVGAKPVLVDIDPETWCLDADQIETAAGPKTRAIIVSHLHGGLARMDQICEVAQRHGMYVIEDACQAPGAVVQGKLAGTWGDVGVLSFGGSKLLTAGRGGAILTRHDDVYQRAKLFCEQGNNAFPLSELQAAVLLPQLNKLDSRNARRRAAVAMLLESLGELPGLDPVLISPALGEPSFYKVAWRYDEDKFGRRSREVFVNAVRCEGIAIDAGFRGFMRRGSQRCRRTGDCTHSRRGAQSTVLLHHPILLQDDDSIDQVARAIRKVARAFQAV
jgi:dTDP-4-amino-4,6-dideoxygalactose transaminase